MTNLTSKKISATDICKTWLTQSVIAHNFCPYAKLPYEKGQIVFVEYHGQSTIELLEELAKLCLVLDDDLQIETALLICASQDYLSDFYDYLDVLDGANELLQRPKKMAIRFSDGFQNTLDNLPPSWEEAYQIASFHPNYVFEGAGSADRENYTNRSPLPIFHLLRNNSIDKVKMTDDKADKIVQRNCEHLLGLADDDFKTLQALSNLR